MDKSQVKVVKCAGYRQAFLAAHHPFTGRLLASVTVKPADPCRWLFRPVTKSDRARVLALIAD